MDLLDLLGLLLLAAAVWLWLDSLKARETAVAAARAACSAEYLLLLDDTVAISRIGPARDDDGVLCVRRVYGFEYTDTGSDRNTGSIALLGSRVLVVNLNLPETPERNALRGPET